ncbi:hypothetical protein GCM10010284_67060 [Streptomyces rubiginosohelvolus]|nr:hypothetical protein GCM10010284_67060 [Streptomyces rubiginosohelvolus]
MSGHWAAKADLPQPGGPIRVHIVPGARVRRFIGSFRLRRAAPAAWRGRARWREGGASTWWVS